MDTYQVKPDGGKGGPGGGGWVMDEHRLPQIHITHNVTGEDGRTYNMPLTSPVCDFCGHDSPAWEYDCHDFLILGTDMASAGAWGACTPCSDMIEAENWEGVFERALLAGRKLGIEEATRIQATLMHKGFRECRYGPRKAWG